MFRAKLMISVVLMAVSLAQLQCITACAGERCGPTFPKMLSVPPCHRHHDHSQDRSPGSCSHRLVNSPAIASHVFQVQSPTAAAFGLSLQDGDLSLDTFRKPLRLVGFSPPESVHTASSVLRI